MIIKYLRQYHKASRQDLDTLLLDKLSDVLDDAQKRNKVRNLVQAMANANIVTAMSAPGGTLSGYLF